MRVIDIGKATYKAFAELNRKSLVTRIRTIIEDRMGDR
jgi:hypothetical protein